MSVQASVDGVTLSESDSVDKDEEEFKTPLSSPTGNIVPKEQLMVSHDQPITIIVIFWNTYTRASISFW